MRTAFKPLDKVKQIDLRIVVATLIESANHKTARTVVADVFYRIAVSVFAHACHVANLGHRGLSFARQVQE
jgi:hypothetical protein